MRYLGTIDNAGSDVKTSKAGMTNSTSTPFAIPAGAKALVVQPSATSQHVVVDVLATVDFSPAAAAMLALPTANEKYTIPLDGQAVQLACRKTDAGAGTLKVFAVLGSL